MTQKYSIPVMTALCAASFSATAFAQSVTWHAERATASGNGCAINVDTQVIAAGNDMSVIFSNMGVDMPGGSPIPYGQYKYCNVKVPIGIARGLKVDDIGLYFTYGGVKSKAAFGHITTKHSFYGNVWMPLTVRFPEGQEFFESQVVQRVGVPAGANPGQTYWCNRWRPAENALWSNVLVEGLKRAQGETFIMQVAGYDMRIDAELDVSSCP